MEVDVRVADAEDLPALTAALGQPEYFARRLDVQAAGLGELLVAWVDGRPVGDVFVSRDEPYEAKVREIIGDLPTLTHLEVTPELHGRGIGTALLAAAHRSLSALGYWRVGLGVAVDNPDARRLYERLGYREWEHGPVGVDWDEHDERGRLVHRSLVCDYLTKTIPAGDAPDVSAWDGWHPRAAADRLAGAPLPWAVAGGWAIDLHLGQQTRAHGDLEIAIPRGCFPELRPSLQGLHLYEVGGGRLRRLADTDVPHHRQIWAAEEPARVWRMDTFLEPGDRETWVSHRDARIQLPLAEAIRHTADGIPYLAPATVLLAKAKHVRAKDEADLAVTVPTLSAAERGWLAEALALAHPGHAWLERLA